jgi:hypothetical protein
LDWAKKKFSTPEVAFANAAFFTARVLRVPFQEKELFMTLHPLQSPGKSGTLLSFLVRDWTMALGLGDLDCLSSLAPQLGSLALDIYPRSMQHMLVEAMLDPIFFQMQALFREKVTLKTMAKDTKMDPEATPIQCKFAVYGAYPHGDEPALLLLEGSLGLANALAERLLKSIASVDSAIYRTYERTLPECHLNAASLVVSVNELKNLRTGDVILLEDSAAMEQKRRSLSGLAGYTIWGKQDGDKLTVERMVPTKKFEEMNP